MLSTLYVYVPSPLFTDVIVKVAVEFDRDLIYNVPIPDKSLEPILCVKDKVCIAPEPSVDPTSAYNETFGSSYNKISVVNS